MVCAWLFVIIGRPQDIFDWLKVIHPGDVSAGLAMLSFSLSRSRQPIKPLSMELKLFLVFFMIAFICSPFGYYPKMSLLFLWRYLGKTFILVFLISNLVNNEKQLRMLIYTIMVGGFTMAIAGVLKEVTGRVQVGSTYDPNDLALIMVIALPLSIAEIMGNRSAKWKLFCVIGSVLCLVTIVATQSRGGLLGLISIAITFFVMKGMPFPKGKVLLLLGVLGVVFYWNLSPDYKERMKTIFEERIQDMQAGSGRVLIWKRAISIANDNPIMGVGPGCFMTAYGDYLANGKFPETLSEENPWPGWRTAHNSYLLILAELGVPGLIIYLAIIFRSFRNLNWIKTESHSQSELNLLATGIKVSFIAFMVCAFFLSQSYNQIIFVYLILSGEMVRITLLQKG